MSDLHDDDFLPPELAEVGRRLRAERAQATPLELDRIKVQARARARRKASPWSISLKGRSMRSRYLVLALTALLLGGTTAGGIAGGGGSSSGYGSATSQYRPPICNRDRSVCACPGGSMFNDDQLQCVCPQGESFDNYGRCQPSKPPPPPPPPCKGKGYNGYWDGGNCLPPPYHHHPGDHDRWDGRYWWDNEGHYWDGYQWCDGHGHYFDD